MHRAILEIHKGQVVFSSFVVDRYQDLQRHHLKGEVGGCLTPRQTEVLQLVAEGKANKQIAAELDISIKTVEKHRQNLMEKLNLHDTAGLVRFAMSTGTIAAERGSLLV